jgi:hypothetical protein
MSLSYRTSCQNPETSVPIALLHSDDIRSSSHCQNKSTPVHYTNEETVEPSCHDRMTELLESNKRNDIPHHDRRSALRIPSMNNITHYAKDTQPRVCLHRFVEAYSCSDMLAVRSEMRKSLEKSEWEDVEGLEYRMTWIFALTNCYVTTRNARHILMIRAQSTLATTHDVAWHHRLSVSKQIYSKLEFKIEIQIGTCIRYFNSRWCGCK